MTIAELIKCLGDENCPPSMFAFEEGADSDCYCLVRVKAGWSVYYIERGRRAGEKYFGSEEDACNYLNWLLREAKKWT